MGTNSEVPKTGPEAVRDILRRLTVLERAPRLRTFESAYPNQDTLVLRTPDSTIKAADPIASDDVATKNYVDSTLLTRVAHVNRVVITTTSNYTPPAGLLYADVEEVGGGGAGGGAPTTTASQSAAGSGGGSGEFAQGLFTAADIAAALVAGVIPVTIGPGGTGVVGGNGNNGGTTSFGSLMTANGGGGGDAGTPSASQVMAAQGTAGAGGSGGDLHAPGTPGDRGLVMGGEPVTTGKGGSSRFGGGGNGSPSSVAGGGSNANGYGAGGGGALNRQGSGTTARAGGNGSPGLVVVTEYLSA